MIAPSQSTAVVGLTGGMASGKSTVATRWRERGARVIDADQLARDVVAPGEPALEAIREAFGDAYLQDDGTLNRAKLGGLVFQDRQALARLNAITHPAILRAVGQALIKAHHDGLRWVVYEAALILENRLAPGLSCLAVVVCDPELQVRRAMARTGMSEADARARLAAQTDNATRLAVADHVIDNGGTLEELHAAADRVFDTLQAQYGALTA